MKDGNVYGEHRKPYYKNGRICKTAGCGTVLSRYNQTNYCYFHNLKIKDKKVDLQYAGGNSKK